MLPRKIIMIQKKKPKQKKSCIHSTTISITIKRKRIKYKILSNNFIRRRIKKKITTIIQIKKNLIYLSALYKVANIYTKTNCNLRVVIIIITGFYWLPRRLYCCCTL